ncbi:hypothetical protein BX600DRAFT_504502 [Xylariales sp. PMI_506]|nr:hypothetical protein BX600DRAFT_504502 [Xylariales sp. PMI_506]
MQAGDSDHQQSAAPVPTAQSQPPRRSKGGCRTCRAKKVKCDETRPACARCIRLRLECAWNVEPPPLRQRRRGHGSIRTRESWKPSLIRPRIEAEPQSPAAVTDPHAVEVENISTFFAPVGDGTVSTAVARISPILPFLQRNFTSVEVRDHYIISGSRLDDGAIEENVDDDSLESSFDSDALTSMATSSHIQFEIPSTWEAFCAPWTANTNIEFPLPEPLSPFPLSPPCSVPLTSLEHRALDHYSTTFSIYFTKKHPKWSTLSMLRVLGMGSPMIMHFLLAVSLNDLWWRGGTTNHVMQTAAQRHYKSGANLLASMMRDGAAMNGAHGDAAIHTHIMAAFWFLYLYKTKAPAVDVDFLKQLSKTVMEHIRRYKLDELCSGSDSPSDTQTSSPGASDGLPILSPTSCSARDGSLIALMIICLYYQDIKYGFYHCGGELAQHLNSNKVRLGRIYDLGRNALALNWGAEYPVSELVDDSENYSILKFNSELNIVLEDLNREFGYTRSDEAAKRQFQAELDRLQVRYATVFETSELVAGGKPAKSRTGTNADMGTAYFHAVQIYLFRCTLDEPSTETPGSVQAALNAILLIARRVLGPENAIGGSGPSRGSGVGEDHALFHRLEWPLFIAGVETNDVIYQDWILQKLAKGNTRLVFEKVLDAQARTGQRVGIEFLRESFLQKR